MLKIFIQKFLYIFFIFTPIFIFAEENQCQIFLNKYSDMDIESLERAAKIKKSSLEKKIYKNILKDKQEIIKRSNASFKTEIDDFTGDATYKTSITRELRIKKGVCKTDKKYIKGSIRSGDYSRGFMRKICRNYSCAPIQYYLIYSLYREPIAQYYGINRAVIKGIGEVDFTLIDLEYFAERYTAHIGINLTRDQLEELSSLGESPQVKIYSKSGIDQIINLEINQINVFMNGLKSNDAWID